MDEDKLPKYSYDLIRMLDEETPRPQLPYSAEKWAEVDQAKLQALAFCHGMRRLVDNLVEQMEEENSEDDEEHTDAPSDDSFDQALPEDIRVRSIDIARPIRVVSDVAEALLGSRDKPR